MRRAGVANVNDAPTGAVTITGTASEDQILTADTSRCGCRRAWRDQLPVGALQTVVRPGNIGGATGATYTLGDADVGSQST